MVCLGAESFRMKICGQLPFNKKDNGKEGKCLCVPAFNKEKRCAHHKEVPVVYAAGSAAAVLHEPGLKRAEEQDADHITNGICKSYDDQNTFIDDSCEKENANGSV